MANSKSIPEANETLSEAHYYSLPRKELHCLKKPTGYVSGMAHGNVGYQMAYSMKVLEEQLAAEEKYYVLQLNTETTGRYGWQDPNFWRLYANGVEVASGTGEYAKECFYTSETAFLELCRNAIETRNVPKIDKREYKLLKIAQRIASYEPFDSGNSDLGSRPGRL